SQRAPGSSRGYGRCRPTVPATSWPCPGREPRMTTDRPTQLGMVGLGRMGSNLVRRLMRDGHPCAVYDVSADAVATLAGEGATGADTIEGFAAGLAPPGD